MWMWRRAPIGRVRVSHLAVACPDGREARIPWSEVRACNKRLLTLSPLARYLWPSLPPRIRVSDAVGMMTVTALRTRAVERQIADGTLDRFWLNQRRCNLASIAVANAALTVLILGGAYAWAAHMAAGLPHGEAESASEILEHTRHVAGRCLLLFGIILPAVLLAAHAWLRRQPHAIALRVTSAGVEIPYDDGRRVFHRWQDLPGVNYGGRTSIRIPGCFIASRRNGGDPDIVLAALAKRYLARQRRPRLKPPAALRRGLAQWLALTLFLSAFVSTLVVMAESEREAARARGKQPPDLRTSLCVSNASMLIPGGAALLVLAGEVGCHRLRLRLAQAFGWRPARHC
jgi:hypothetical protein